MDIRGLSKRIKAKTLEKEGRRGRGEKAKEWTYCMIDDLRLFGMGDGKGCEIVWFETGKWWEMTTERGSHVHACMDEGVT